MRYLHLIRIESEHCGVQMTYSSDSIGWKEIISKVLITGNPKNEWRRGPACHAKNAEQHLLHFVDRMEGDIQTNIIGLVYLQDAQLVIEMIGNVSVCKRRFWGHFRNMAARQNQWWVAFLFNLKKALRGRYAKQYSNNMSDDNNNTRKRLSPLKTNVTSPMFVSLFVCCWFVL